MAEDTKIEVKGGKLRTTLQVTAVGFLGIIGFLLGDWMLRADRHNDERYVSKAEYQKDRENDERMRAATMAMIAFRLDDTAKKIDDIGHDVKLILTHQSISKNQ